MSVLLDINSLQDFISNYQDSVEWQQSLLTNFNKKYVNDPEFVKYRNWILANQFGFGEDEFLVMWDLIIKHILQIKNTIKFCEIGVFKGQILAFVNLIFDRYSSYDNKIFRYGISPLDSSGGVANSNYKEDIEHLHTTFGISNDYEILNGSSVDSKIIGLAKSKSPFDILYIDGSHEYTDVISDLTNYLPMVISGGILVIDDASNNLNCAKFNRFWGIEQVSKAVDEIMPPLATNNEWRFIGNVLHNRLFIKL